MQYMLIVGLGGALGAMSRFLINTIPCKMLFPIITLGINLLGALAIGFIAGISTARGLPKSWIAFWQTGFCGGFTTFSTFSLEAMILLQNKHYISFASYISLSVILCILGVMLGQYLALELSRS